MSFSYRSMHYESLNNLSIFPILKFIKPCPTYRTNAHAVFFWREVDRASSTKRGLDFR